MLVTPPMKCYCLEQPNGKHYLRYIVTSVWASLLSFEMSNALKIKRFPFLRYITSALSICEGQVIEPYRATIENVYRVLLITESWTQTEECCGHLKTLGCIDYVSLAVTEVRPSTWYRACSNHVYDALVAQQSIDLPMTTGTYCLMQLSKLRMVSLTLKQPGHIFKMLCYSLMMFTINVIPLYEK